MPLIDEEERTRALTKMYERQFGISLSKQPARRSKEGCAPCVVCERCGGSWIADYALGSTYHCDTCGNRRDEENPHKHEWLTLAHGATCKLCGLEIYDGTDDGG